MSIHDKWFISDTHFFHTNIIKFCERPFNNTHEMNEALIDNWNAVVKDNDYVYHLGDVAMGQDKALPRILSRLKGRKRLIVGNHDKLKSQALQDYFEKIMLWHGFKEFNFTASHMPLKEGHFRDGAFNVHGHLHRNKVMLKDMLVEDPRYINVCVENTNYRPIHLDEIRGLIAKASDGS